MLLLFVTGRGALTALQAYILALAFVSMLSIEYRCLHKIGTTESSCRMSSSCFCLCVHLPAHLPHLRVQIRVAPEDVEKERGAVLEEWRERRNAAGRMQEAYWQLLMKGSKASCAGS